MHQLYTYPFVHFPHLFCAECCQSDCHCVLLVLTIDGYRRPGFHLHRDNGVQTGISVTHAAKSTGQMDPLSNKMGLR